MHQRPKHPNLASSQFLLAPPRGFDAPDAREPLGAAQNDNDGDDAPRLANKVPSGFYQAPRPTTVVAEAAGPLRVPESAEAAAGTLRGHIDWLDAEAVLDELDEDLLVLNMRIAGLECARELGSKDQATQTALRPLHDCLGDLIAVCDALAALQRAATVRGGQRAFLPNAPLADYLRGVYAWMHAVVRALEELVFGVRRGERKTKPMDLGTPDEPNEPDWGAYRWRIEEAKNFHFDELEVDIRIDLADLLEDLEDHHEIDLAGPPSPNPIGALIESFGVLLGRARALESRLDRE